MSTLQSLYDDCESIVVPDTAVEEELDEQIFMVIDIETMVMAYAEAVLSGIKPNFSLDVDNLEKLQKNVGRFEELASSDIEVQQQLLKKLTALKKIRDLLLEQ